MTLHFMSRLLLKMRAGTKKSRCLSHHFMLENGFIHQVGSGLFALLPIGQRAVDKLQRLVEAQLCVIGAQKIDLPQIVERNLWNQTGRWQKLNNELFRLTDRAGQEFCLQPTAEELVTKVVNESVGIPRENCFPILAFQCNQKFRDEPSPKYGLLRSRQFLMNDLYSFDREEIAAQQTYQTVSDVYNRIFTETLSLKNVFRVSADSGVMGGLVSHEFHICNESCEDKIDVCTNCGFSRTVIYNEEVNTLQCSSSSQQHNFVRRNSIEIAHTFQLGTYYSKALKAFSTFPNQPYFMCCFGIGLTRLIAASIDELSVSCEAMRLPYAISPFKIVFILPKSGSSDPLWSFANSILAELKNLPNLRDEVLVDDRLEKSVGRRIADANRLGVPHIFVINSKKTSDPFEVPTLEYFRAIPNEDTLRNEGRVTHCSLFQLACSM